MIGEEIIKSTSLMLVIECRVAGSDSVLQSVVNN